MKCCLCLVFWASVFNGKQKIKKDFWSALWVKLLSAKLENVKWWDACETPAGESTEPFCVQHFSCFREINGVTDSPSASKQTPVVSNVQTRVASVAAAASTQIQMNPDSSKNLQLFSSTREEEHLDRRSPRTHFYCQIEGMKTSKDQAEALQQKKGLVSGQVSTDMDLWRFSVLRVMLSQDSVLQLSWR